jgi:hypothetical protein
MNMAQRLACAVTFAVAFGAAVLTAQAQQPGRIRGEIAKADGAMMSVKLRDGTMLNVKIADDARVAALVKATAADIKPDSYIGIAGVPQADGSIQAFSIHILPAASRGNGEGERPWDARPGSTMNNAYAQSLVVAGDGQALTVKSKDVEKKIILTPATVIAAAAPGNKSELVPGAQIIIMASEKQPDGSVLAKSLYIGRGLTPAM